MNITPIHIVVTRLKTIWQPAAYHGFGHRAGYFEGWYFKIVDATEQRRYAIIPGIFLGKNGIDSHSFVQTLDGASGVTRYHRYPLDAFSAAPAAFDIRVGPNRFTTHAIELNIDRPEQRLVGRLAFDGVTPWPVTWRSPGIMDWYSFVPFMECYHGVLSLDHALRGQLVIDDAAVDFHGGRGYIEKDWGEAFPRAWVWMQTNHFDRTGVSLTASVARIPWLGTDFRGFIVGLWCDGTLYRFASYTGAVIERLEVTEHQVVWEMRGPVAHAGVRRQARLSLVAHRDEEGVDLLHAPMRTAMLQRVLESLTAAVDVTLTVDIDGRPVAVFAGRGRHVGLELGGKLEEIL
ncbi:MAG TPA: hypothetical protein GYA08_08960 [Chloroflexi bacterium]|nr:hypothetical protein [Chloroflexota bacterium]